jgi:hypothetical protein
LIDSREQHGVEVIGPVKVDTTFFARVRGRPSPSSSMECNC